VNKVFDLAKTQLERGVTLIEASAGTGKTFSLAGLILRLVAEEYFDIKEILAVTFTIAATAELKERIRERLHDALRQLREGKSSDEILIRTLVREDLQKSIHAIDLALQSFDEAQVFTIHSFCQQILQDYAFESGASFDGELVPDPTPLYGEVAMDFWRVRLDTASPLICAVLMAWQCSPTKWSKLLERIRNHPDVAFIPPAGKESFVDLTKTIERSVEEIRTEWKRKHSEIKEILEHDSNLLRSQQYFNADRVAELLLKIAEACGEFDSADPLCFKALEDVSSEAIKVGTKNNQTPPKHRFFELCTIFASSVQTLLLRFTYDFLAYAEKELHRRKAQTNTVNFDDLVLALRRALMGPSADRLAMAIGAKYRAVLVDEFQDTDPAQYEIFQRVFGSGKHHLYYIGDPKQAIYGFRGADVFTYLGAAHDARRTLTLGTNWRSEWRLVSAVNALFQQREDPFILQGISYHRIEAASDPTFPMLTDLPKAATAPLSLRFVASTRDDGEAMNKPQSTTAVCDAVAADIKRLLASSARLVSPTASRKLGLGHMAVLVRTNDQAQQMQEVLTRQNIRAIMQSEQSVFASDEAAELHDFLRGLLDPAREKAFKRALITSIIALNGDELLQLEGNEPERQRWLDKFFEWRTRWSTECFIAAFRQVIVEQKLRARLVDTDGGERRLTNFLHLGELLHGAETTLRLKPDALVDWLAKQRKSSRVSQDEFQLRLESDSDAVQVVTVHKAKGLQYPVVFCPFTWTSADSNWWDELQFHDRDKADKLTFSLRGTAAGSAQQKQWASEERTSEEVRMLYVAITRARNRCNVYVPDYRSVHESALALLFKPAARNDLPKALARLADKNREYISFSTVKDTDSVERGPESEAAQLAARAFTARIDRTAMIASFSGLNTGRIELEEQEPEITDAPEVVVEEEVGTGNGIFDFARGARAGDFFHAVLERLDFVQPDLEPLVDEQLLWHGFAGTKCRDALLSTLTQLLEVELEPGMALRQVSKAARLSELEFTYRLKRLDPAGLAALFKRSSDLSKRFIGNLERLRFDPVEGYLRGFIDLFFEFGGRYFVVDWKSNWLGNRISDYGATGMQRAMLDHNYFLQAQLYVLAADLFLQNQIPNYDYERDFGGVFYLFLRGIDRKNPKSGVYTQRPTQTVVKLLRELAA
jgi:exodeoxyribonuclease V beta subunit